MTASRNSAFYWRGQSSIFATDPAFTPRTNGKTASQIGAETVARRTREEGRNPAHCMEFHAALTLLSPFTLRTTWARRNQHRTPWRDGQS